MKKHPLDPSYFHGAVGIEKSGSTLRPWRLPVSEIGLYESTHGLLVDKAARCAGVRIRFRTDSPVIELIGRIETEDDRKADVDLVGHGAILATQKGEGDRVVFDGLDGQSTVYELWLPVFAICHIEGISLADGAAIEPVPDERPRWITYGSSITHCSTATSPALTWPAVAAHQCDLNLTCLGYGGNCHLEPMLGRLIRNLPADIITLKLGINVYGGASLNQRTFAANAVGLVQLIREKHPLTPIGLITPIYSCERETTPNAVGMTLEHYREQLRIAFEALRSSGDKKLFLFEGRDLLWADEVDLLPDRLHPNGEGYQRMGQRAAKKILPVLLGSRAGG